MFLSQVEKRRRERDHIMASNVLLLMGEFDVMPLALFV
jgi:hypothetical protein